jgi:UDP:flavonoid glycosyltransferase YjiC (YdhE family)
MRFLFTSNPLVGHWSPMLPLARAAQVAGHDVVIATGSDAVPELERRGFPAWSVGPVWRTVWDGLLSSPPIEHQTAEDEELAGFLALWSGPARARAHGLVELTRAWPPDIVVREFYEFAGLYVRATCHVTHGLGVHDPDLIQLSNRALDDLRSTLGDPASLEPIEETLYVDPIPPALQPPDCRPFTEFISMRTRSGEVRTRETLPTSVLALPPDRTVYLTFGTIFNPPEVFAMPLRALSQLPINVVATCGSENDPAALEPLPANIVVEQYISQALLLPRCSAVVCHGGAGTVIGALAQGLPMVCLPQGADQFNNSAQVSRVGAGITLTPDQASAESIKDAVQRVLNEPQYRAAARSLRNEISHMRDPAAVVQHIATAATDGAAHIPI